MLVVVGMSVARWCIAGLVQVRGQLPARGLRAAATHAAGVHRPFARDGWQACGAGDGVQDSAQRLAGVLVEGKQPPEQAPPFSRRIQQVCPLVLPGVLSFCLFFLLSFPFSSACRRGLQRVSCSA